MRRRPSRRWTATCCGLLLAGTAVTGCSGGDDDTSADQPSASSSSSSSASSSGSSPESGSADPSSSESASASSDATPGESLGSKTFTVTGTYTKVDLTMRFDLVRLVRQGDLLQVLATVTNTATDKSADLRWQVAQGLEGGNARDDLKNYDGAFSGAILTDVGEKKRYLVAADSSGACVCTVDLSGTFIGAGQTIQLTATYAAPPETTTKLNVDVANVGEFLDVPIS